MPLLPPVSSLFSFFFFFFRGLFSRGPLSRTRASECSDRSWVLFFLSPSFFLSLYFFLSLFLYIIYIYSTSSALSAHEREEARGTRDDDGERPGYEQEEGRGALRGEKRRRKQSGRSQRGGINHGFIRTRSPEIARLQYYTPRTSGRCEWRRWIAKGKEREEGILL